MGRTDGQRVVWTGSGFYRRYALPLALLATIGATAARATDAVLPVVELDDGRRFLHGRLDNGLEVSVLADPGLELVATQVWYRVGSADEEEGSRGLAHLFEHLMFGPAAGYGKDAVFHWHHRHGGDNNAFTDFDATVYVSEVLPPHHLEVLSIEAARMRDLEVTGEELENEQRIVKEELRLRLENDPVIRVMVRALETFGGEHPYALTPAGTKRDIDAATVVSASGFYDRFYRPNNAHVVVAGPVDPRETFAAVRERFAGLRRVPVERREIPPVTEWSFPDEAVLTDDLPPVETAIALFPLPPLDHLDSVALDLLLTMIGGATDPFREDLVRRRDKALEAGFESFRARRGGVLAFYSVQLPYRRKVTAFRQIERSLDSVADSLTDERLAAAKRRLLRERAVARYSAAAEAGAVGRARWLVGDVDDAFRREERIRHATLDDVRGVWDRYVEQRAPSRLYVKPEKVPIAVRLFGWLYPLVN